MIRRVDVPWWSRGLLLVSTLLVGLFAFSFHTGVAWRIIRWRCIVSIFDGVFCYFREPNPGGHGVTLSWTFHTFRPETPGIWWCWPRFFEPGHNICIQFPIYIPVLAFVAVALLPVVLKTRVKMRRSRGLCIHCAYDLHGNVSGICPECGTRIRQSI